MITLSVIIKLLLLGYIFYLKNHLIPSYKREVIQMKNNMTSKEFVLKNTLNENLKLKRKTKKLQSERDQLVFRLLKIENSKKTTDHRL